MYYFLLFYVINNSCLIMILQYSVGTMLNDYFPKKLGPRSQISVSTSLPRVQSYRYIIYIEQHIETYVTRAFEPGHISI